MTLKVVTNETMIKDLIKDLNGIEIALLRERIVSIIENTKQSIEEDPSSWEKSIVHPSLYLGLHDKVQKHIGFNKK